MPVDLQGPDLYVHLPGLKPVTEMLDRQANAARRCRDYAEDAYSETDYGPGPLRNAQTGVINYLAGTHDRVRGDVREYFDEVHTFASGQAARVQEAVDLYETTDFELAADLDASLYQPARRAEVRELGRAGNPDPYRVTAVSLEPREPADALVPWPDYRADYPFRPDWIGTGRARDTIWEVTWLAHALGMLPRPIDIVAELLDPFTGDWAGFKACGDALVSLAEASRDLHANVGWIEQRVDAVWQGNAADACWLQVRRLQRSLSQVPPVLDGYAEVYEETVTTVRELQEQAAAVLAEALDWAVAVLLGQAGVAGKVLGWFLPPSGLLEVARLIYHLLDLVQLARQAVWDFEARCQLGMLNGPQLESGLPQVPRPSSGYH